MLFVGRIKNMVQNNSIFIKQEKVSSIPLIERFPFPFKGDSYRYSNNSEVLEPPFLLTITPEYVEEIELKRELLKMRKNQCYQSFSHSLEAQWEILEMIINEMTSLYPEYFSVKKDGDHWGFYNHLLKEQQSFIFGDASSLPYEPLDFIGRHVQEDLVYIAQRDGDLYMDAGQLCFPANWSIAFNLGMTYTEFHSPVPHFSDSGLAEKVRKFLLRMEAGKPWTRLNWTLTVEPILNTFPETFDEWGMKKEKITFENMGQLVHLRVEDQRLFRLPYSNGILFGIHTHLISLDELKKKEEWINRFYQVLMDLPDYIAQYKGFISYKDELINYLEEIIKTKGSAIK
jgi:dimethylamine monooxygenase subunit A